jgi:hypothetical protein
MLNYKVFIKKSCTPIMALFLTLTLSMAGYSQNAPAAAPKFLFHENSVHSDGKIANEHESVKVSVSNGGIDVVFAGSSADYPGFNLIPSKGKAWDLSPWGHVSAQIKNTGKNPAGLHMRVDNDGDWKQEPWNTESVWLNPGETKTLKVIFGYHYGFKPGFKLNTSAVSQLLFFTGKSDKERSFRIENIVAGGSTGEEPPVNPAHVREKPAGGIVVGRGAKFKHEPKLASRDGAEVSWTPAKTVLVEAPAGKKSTALVQAGVGAWNFGGGHEVKVKLRNIGRSAFKPAARVESNAGPTDDIEAATVLGPGREVEIVIPFAPKTPWVGVPNPVKGQQSIVSGTGTRFESNNAKSIAVVIPATENDVKFEITSVLVSDAPVVLPNWVGKRPPVEGNWKITLDENFDGSKINLKLWNIYTANYWDSRTHFTKDNTIVKDGKLILRYEKKTGFHNDDPDDKSKVAKTDFACGYADTYGKWTQTYGYFEARMKLPTCSGLWPAFWTMPDRGGVNTPEGHKENPQWKRANTGDGGMEFDIMEHLTAWGPYRFNFAFHWDGYGKDHMAIGTSNAYVPTDKDGFFTIGLLWLPGKAVYYGNGVEIGRWESERVCSVPSYIIIYMVSGGWANTPLDPSSLPDDFIIDYVRAWQRADLATAEDGPKPNTGAPRSQF